MTEYSVVLGDWVGGKDLDKECYMGSHLSAGSQESI